MALRAIQEFMVQPHNQMDYDESASVAGQVSRVSLPQVQKELIAAVESRAC